MKCFEYQAILRYIHTGNANLMPSLDPLLYGLFMISVTLGEGVYQVTFSFLPCCCLLSSISFSGLLTHKINLYWYSFSSLANSLPSPSVSYSLPRPTSEHSIRSTIRGKGENGGKRERTGRETINEFGRTIAPRTGQGCG